MLNLIDLPATRIAALAAAAAALLSLAAPADAADEFDLRLVPQLLVGTSGIEPGAALEFRPEVEPRIVLRPEAFFSEDGKLGGGGAALWDFSDVVDLPDEFDLSVGPRVIYHNSDDDGLEVAGMAIFGYDLGINRPWRHSLEGIVAVGAVQDRENDDTDPGFSVGGAYAFGF